MKYDTAVHDTVRLESKPMVEWSGVERSGEQSRADSVTRGVTRDVTHNYFSVYPFRASIRVKPQSCSI